MNLIRIIPRLDIKGPKLVKGVHLEGLRVLGKPESFASEYEFFSSNTDVIILPRNLVQDIDTLEDWEVAESLYAYINML